MAPGLVRNGSVNTQPVASTSPTVRGAMPAVKARTPRDSRRAWPQRLTARVKVVEGSTSGTTTVTQKAAEAALDGPQDCVADMVAAYRRRRDLVVELLREAGLLLSVPRGAFYILADVAPSGLDPRVFAGRLLAERGVAVAPGTAFGEVARDAVRISLASSDQNLREGVGHLCELVSELARTRLD